MIRPIIIFLVAGLIGLFIQATLIHSSMPASAAPDFILILVVVVSRQLHTPWGALAAFALGLLADFASAQYLGPNAGGCVLAFLLVGMIANRVYADKVIAVFLITALCSLVKSLFIILMLWIELKDFVFTPDLSKTIFLEAVFSGLFAPIVMRALGLKASGAARAGSKFQSTPIFRWS